MPFREPGFFDVLIMDIIETPLKRKYFERYIERLGISGGERVLDFGSGPGRLSLPLAKRLAENGGRLTCADASAVWMKRLKKKLRNAGNVDYLHFAPGQFTTEHEIFDLAVVHFVLHDVDKSDRQSIVNVIAHGLKHGGRLVITEPTSPNHGMPSGEIRELAHQAGLVEERSSDETVSSFRVTKTVFRGEYRKP